MARVPRDHLVPRLHLRRFATTDERLVALPRDGGPSIPTTVRKACAETIFYDVELEEPYQEEFPVRKVEEILSTIEGAAETAIRKLISHHADDVTAEDRYNLVRFIAFQLVRGWSFRDELSEMATLCARHELAGSIDAKAVRRFLQERGSRAEDTDVDEFIESVLTNAWRVVPSGSMAVQAMAAAALHAMPLLWQRRIRVIVFEEPRLITSDQPVVLWGRPSRDLQRHPIGVATADAIWMPLDRRHAVGLLASGREVIVAGRPSRAQQINTAVASSARRWIYQHPDDPLFDTSELRPQPPLVAEPVAVRDEGDQLRVRYRTVRASP